MRSQIYLLFAIALLFSCKEDPKEEPNMPLEGYRVSGEAKGLVNGLRAYLQSTNEKGFLKDRDTAIIMNERFVFEGKADTTQAYHLVVNSLDGSFPFVIDNGEITLNINSEDIKKSEISGTVFNDQVSEYNRRFYELNDSLELMTKTYMERLINKENVKGMSQKIESIRQMRADLPFNFVLSHTDNPYGLVLLNYMIRRNTGDQGKIVASYDSLPENLKESNLGKRINRSIPHIRRKAEIIAATALGRVAPEFSGPSPNGTTIALNSVKGKATLVHFWSSWFAASRRENKRLVDIYKNYHPKGLEMIGVSVDGNERQVNPKREWKQAIKDDKLIWPQISNLNYFNDTISKAYSVRTLPASFLLNSNGEIVAKNLTGRSLEEKLKELLED